LSERFISVITPCYNEEANVEELYLRVRRAMTKVGRYAYEHIFIDNHSRDHTVAVLKTIASRDTNVRIIVNARNFGQVRSPMHAFLETRGDAVIGLAADLQDPPEMIEEMIAKWEEGYAMVLCIKETSQENRLLFRARTLYYRLVQRLSSLQTFENFTGFGLFDRKVVETVRSFGDAYPYFRGMIAEIGLPHFKLIYNQPRRKRGVTNNNFYTLYDLAMLGITNLSKVPLRLVTFFGFLSDLQAVVLEQFFRGDGAVGDWVVFPRLGAVGVDGDSGRIHWGDPYAGVEAALCGGAGAREFRV
jgi:glycosyltransferase involved in cell wall biosynthesis